MSPVLASTTERWRFDPPVTCQRHPAEGGVILVHWVDVTTAATGSVSVSIRGVPTTKAGKPNGVIDYRNVPDAEEQRLYGLVLAAKSPSAVNRR